MATEAEEQWAHPPGMSKYWASTKGRIINARGRLLNPKPHKNGYTYVRLRADDDSYKQYSVHRITAMTFVSKPEGKDLVDHKNRQRSSNGVKNLQWVTRKDNAKNVSAPIGLRTRAVNQYSIDGVLIKEWDSVVNICREFKIDRSRVDKACLQGDTLLDYQWRYVDLLPIEGEEWRSIQVGKHIIHASSEGRVQTLAGTLTYGFRKDRAGYLGVEIDGHTCGVHRIICQAFHPIEHPELYQPNHKDLNPGNNKALNLEWATVGENISHSVQMKGTAKTLRVVNQFDLNGKFIKRFDTLREASLSVGDKASTHLVDVCEGRRNYHKGFIWRYVEGNTLAVKPIKLEKSQRPVNQYTVKGDLVKRFSTISEASTTIGDSSAANIIKCCDGRSKTSRGFVWKYADLDISGDSDELPLPEDTSPVEVGFSSEISRDSDDELHLPDDTSLTGTESPSGTSDGDSVHHSMSLQITTIDKASPYKTLTGTPSLSHTPPDSPTFNTEKRVITSERPVNQYTRDGVFVRRFDTAKDAAKSINNPSPSNIVYACEGLYRQMKGYIWRFADEDTKVTPISIDKCERAVSQYTPRGKFVCDFQTMKEAAEAVHTNVGNIRAVCQGKSKTSKDFIWCYTDTVLSIGSTRPDIEGVRVKKTERPVCQYSLEGEYIQTFTNANVARPVGARNGSNILSACETGKSAYGYRWKYADEN